MKRLICICTMICFFASIPGVAVVPKAIAVELGDETVEVDLGYSNGEIQACLSRMKNNLRDGLSNELEIALLYSMEAELHSQVTDIETKAEIVRTTMAGQDMTAFDTELAQWQEPVKQLRIGLNCILDTSLDTSATIDNVLSILDKQTPNILGNSPPKLATTRVDKPVRTLKARPVKAIGAPPTAADLAFEPNIEIEALATTLGNDPVQMFAWVRNHVDYEPYYGALKGAAETLADMAGNDCDLSTLLVTLLRSSGVPARYVRGNVELKIADLMNWVGGKTPAAAIDILQRSGTPVEVLRKNGEIEGIIFDHVWVEIYTGHKWTLADPSWKIYTYTTGTGIDHISVADFDPNNIVSSTGDNTVNLNIDRLNAAMAQQIAIIESEIGHMEINEVLNHREIVVADKNNLPPYLARGILGDRKPAEDFSILPDDLQTKVRFTMPGGEVFETPVADVTGKQVSISYIPATEKDAATLEFWGGIYEVLCPSLLVKMIAVLSVNDQVMATGEPVGLGLLTQYVEFGFLQAGETDWETTYKWLRSGNRYNVCVATQKTPLQQTKQMATELSDTLTGLPETDYMTNEQTDRFLEIGNRLYFGLTDKFANALNSMDIVNTMTSVAVMADEVQVSGFFGIIVNIDRGGNHIDVVKTKINPVSMTGNHDQEVAWTQMFCSIMSCAEHTLFEILFDTDSVSTGTVFKEAAQQGIEFHIFDNPETLETDLRQVVAHRAVKDHIRKYVAAGYIATIPQQNVTIGDWTGQGWTLTDEDTGASGFLICGGLHGGMTEMLNGGQLGAIIAKTLLVILAVLFAIWKILDLLIVTYTMAGSAYVHLLAAFKIFEAMVFSYAAYVFVVPACIWLVLIGLAIFAAAFLVCRLLINNMSACQRRTRRRRYAFA